jgi:hypothetical protein
VLRTQLARDCGVITWRRLSAETDPAVMRDVILTSLRRAA